MKIRIKLDLYVLKEYFLATLCGEKNVGEGLSKSSEGDPHQNPKLLPGMTTFNMKDCLALLAHRTVKCIDFGLWNVVLFLNLGLC